MSKQNDCWGLEVGANAIKAVRLVRTGAELTVADYDILPFKKVLTTPDLNVDEAVQVGLDQFLSRHNVAKTTVVASVPGHVAFARFAKLPPVDPKKIPDIVKFEAVQQIPFPIDQVEWDYQVFAQPDSPDVEVGIFAITKDKVVKFLSNYRNVGLELDGVTLSPLAVYNAMAYDMNLTPDSPGVIFMDIGTASTDVIIVENGQIWLRTLPIGGNNFTEALVRAFKLSFPKAEKLKREAATSKYARQIFQAMRPVFADLVQEMQRSLGFYQSLNRDAKLTKLIGVGSTFRLPGMLKFLKQQLQMDIERPNGFKRVKVAGKEESEFAENAMNLATAYGLALQGLDLGAVNANLLPRHIVRQRLWRAKQPWIAAAAVVMVAATVSAGARLWYEKTAYEDKYQSTAAPLEKALASANRLVNDWHAVEGGQDPRQKIDNLRRILDYRDVWPRMMLDLDMAAMALNPQPALLTSDYDAIRSIPRNERRRFYIDSVSVDYRFVVEEGVVAVARTSGRQNELTLDEVFGNVRRPSKEKSAAGPPQPTQVVVTSSRTPPSFTLTIRGTTPYAEGLKLIGDNYIKWLKENADRDDRPYRIILPDNPIYSISQIPETEGPREPGAPAAPPVSTGLNPGVRAIRNGPGSSAPAPNLTSAIPAGRDELGLITSPFPERVPQPRDWRFEIQWRVQLYRPEVVRESENIDRDKSGKRRAPKPEARPRGAEAPAESPARTEARL